MLHLGCGLDARVFRCDPGPGVEWYDVDTPDDIVDAVPGVRLLAWVSPFDSPTFDDVAWYYRAVSNIMRAVPSLRYMAQYHRWAF